MSGCHGVLVGIKCIKYAQIVATKAEIAIDAYGLNFNKLHFILVQ